MSDPKKKYFIKSKYILFVNDFVIRRKLTKQGLKINNASDLSVFDCASLLAMHASLAKIEVTRKLLRDRAQ